MFPCFSQAFSSLLLHLLLLAYLFFHLLFLLLVPPSFRLTPSPQITTEKMLPLLFSHYTWETVKKVAIGNFQQKWKSNRWEFCSQKRRSIPEPWKYIGLLEVATLGIFFLSFCFCFFHLGFEDPSNWLPLVGKVWSAGLAKFVNCRIIFFLHNDLASFGWPRF